MSRNELDIHTQIDNTSFVREDTSYQNGNHPEKEPLPDGLELYFRDIRDIPFLSADAEASLANAYQEVLADISTETDEPTQELLQTKAHELRTQLITPYLLFAVKKALKFSDRNVPLLDLIQAANESLLGAVRTFDPAKGRFTTLADSWMFRDIMTAIDKEGNNITVPRHVGDGMRKIHNAIKDYENTCEGGNPPIEYLVKATGLSEEHVGRYLQARDMRFMTSLDEEISNEQNGPRRDESLFEDKNSLSPEEDAIVTCMKDDFLKCLNDLLTPQQIEVLCLKYGIGRDEHTYIEIGKTIGFSRERARQVHDEAMEKLQNSEELREKLIEYLQ